MQRAVPPERCDIAARSRLRPMRRRIELSSRNIVNAEFASCNDCGNFLDSDLTRVADLQRTSGNVAAIVNRKHDRFEDRAVMHLTEVDLHGAEADAHGTGMLPPLHFSKVRPSTTSRPC